LVCLIWVRGNARLQRRGIHNDFKAFGSGWRIARAAILGAATGYLLLWAVHHGFRLVTGKNGMGYGDFKLLAAVGAWLGIHAIPTVVLVASMFGITIAVAMSLFNRNSSDQALPFGPVLAGASIAAMISPTV
jgi:leader peptidase (prepilin peptidase)/N-methyltransferase